MGGSQANYAGSAAVAFGDATASEQASAGTASAGARAGWKFRFKMCQKNFFLIANINYKKFKKLESDWY